MSLERKRVTIWVGLAVVAVLTASFMVKGLDKHRIDQLATNTFIQALRTNSHALDDGGSIFEAQLDFNDLHFNLQENQMLEDTDLVPLLTVPATTPQTNFLLVLAVKTAQNEFTSFSQSDVLHDPALFQEHLHKVFTQRGICQVIIEIDNHINATSSSFLENPDSWSVMLAKKQSVYVSSYFGRVVIPTHLNIVSCQN